MRFRNLICLIMSLIPVTLLGDGFPPILNEEPEELVRYKIDDFQTYLNRITSEKKTKGTADVTVKACMRLFIGNGEGYSYNDIYGYETKSGPAELHLINRSGRVRSCQLKRFLTELTNLKMRSYEYKVIGVEYLQVDSILSSSDNGYNCLAYLNNYLKYSKDESPSNWDITRKKVKVFIGKDELICGPEACYMPSVFLVSIYNRQIP